MISFVRVCVCVEDDAMGGLDAKKPEGAAAPDAAATNSTAPVEVEQTVAFRHLSKVGLWVELTPTTDQRPIEVGPAPVSLPSSIRVV